MPAICSSSRCCDRSTLPSTAPMVGVSGVMLIFPVFVMASSPDMHAVLWRDVKFVARLHVEGSVPRIDIAHDSVDAELPRRVRIADDLLLHIVVADLPAPGL